VLTVALVSTGHEVLRGHTLNTNASWLARRATEVGARVTSVRTVGDDLPDLEAAIRDATREARCVIVTGGLGPTEDDRNREALARVLGVPLLDDERAWAIVRRFFERSAREPSPMQRRQALVPRGAEPLDNAEGTAPGLLAHVGEATVFLLPGPPREMRTMFEREVLTRWRAAGSAERLDETASRVVWTAGAPESEIATAIEDLMRAPEPVVGTHPDEGEVAVRLLARGPGAPARADAAVAEIVSRLGGHVVSTDEDVRVQHAVVALLKARGLVVTTAESLTGGLIARMLVEAAGASDVFRGGFVVYSDAWKRDVLGVPAALLATHGAVSEPVARAMAEGARRRAGAEIAVATTGVAGPGPDSHGVPEGTVHVAVATAAATTHVAARIALPRLAVQRRAAVLALDQARRVLAPN
jgi:nicotinamide-nucleotide amidase